MEVRRRKRTAAQFCNVSHAYIYRPMLCNCTPASARVLTTVRATIRQQVSSRRIHINSGSVTSLLAVYRTPYVNPCTLNIILYPCSSLACPLCTCMRVCDITEFGVSGQRQFGRMHDHGSSCGGDVYCSSSRKEINL
jgi:hypothetical protein